MSDLNNYVMGNVHTRKVGSGCEFEVCTKEEYAEMNDDQRHKALIEAMWDAGILDISFVEESLP